MAEKEKGKKKGIHVLGNMVRIRETASPECAEKMLKVAGAVEDFVFSKIKKAS
jgi:hypothetical protein